MRNAFFPNIAVVIATSAILSTTVSHAQGKITLQHDGQFTYYHTDSLQAVFNAAQNGDLVLLPGGTFTGPFTLDRGISLIGVGCDPDSTTATTASAITGFLYLGESADNSYISGINFTSYISGVSSARVDNVIIHRCIIRTSISSFNANSSNWLITESIVGFISSMKSCHISNCIIDSRIESHNNLTVEYCIFLDNTINSNRNINNCTNCSVQGCVFTNITGQVSGYSSQWTHIANNVFVSTTPGTYVTNVQNILGSNQANLFVDYSGVTYWNAGFDFHLAPGSPAIGAGPGGTNCGIYGGATPWKEGSVPITPHIQQQVIGTTTNATGGLPVQIKVAAQDH